MSTHGRPPVELTPVDPDLHHRIEQFLFYEAELLDRFAMEEWLSLINEELVLKVPIRSDRGPGSERPTFSDETYYLYNDYDMLRERVDKLSKEYAWSENPRSRVRHHLGNVRVSERDDGDYRVWNNQFVYRSQGDSADYKLLSAQRESTIREVDTEAGFELVDRTVYLDHSVLTTKNITLPLL